MQLLVRLVATGDAPDMLYFVSSLTGAALWPAVVGMLMLPMRRRQKSDEV